MRQLGRWKVTASGREVSYIVVLKSLFLSVVLLGEICACAPTDQGINENITAADQVKRLPNYPDTSENPFLVKYSDAWIDTLHITAGLTMKLDPSIKSIHWTVIRMVVDPGNYATLDVSAPPGKPDPSPAATGVDKIPIQADYCQVGAKGNPGHSGTPGNPSIPVTVTGIREININGYLWIKTDGGLGGDGGRGGTGQIGGGNQSGGPFAIGHCGFAPGGPGGDGGQGGSGGGISPVTFTTATDPIQNLVKTLPPGSGCAQKNQNTPPLPTTPNSGLAIAFGTPGCAGNRGPEGPPGAEGARRG